MLAPWPRSQPPVRRRRAVLGLLAVLAVLMHFAFLGGLPWLFAPAGKNAVSASSLQVRVLQPVPALPDRVPAIEVSPAASPDALPSPPPTTRRAAAARPKRTAAATALAEASPSSDVGQAAGTSDASDASLPLNTPIASTLPELDLAPQVPSSTPEAAASAPANAADGVVALAAGPLAPAPVAGSTALPGPLPPTVPPDLDREIPVYRTSIPPATTLRYAIRRGPLSGVGEFQWALDGVRYEARLEGSVAGITVLSQVSKGEIDEAGVAPLRFTDQRVAGSVRAANFQREQGKITFSGPGVEHPLLIGSQDRLSWMVQLGAVVSAEPHRLQPGGKVVIHVVGARGDSRLWIFKFAARETILSGAGTAIPAIKFVRETADAYDTRVEVWLDPQRYHLPARAVLHSGGDGDSLELLVQDAAAP